MKIELCAGRIEDCKLAEKYGLDRIEFVSSYNLGGLTPTYSNLKYALDATNVPIVAMIRNKAGNFNYTSEDMKAMFLDAEIFLKNLPKLQGLVFGFLTENGKIDEINSKKMVELIHKYGKEAVFHRAFDCLENREEGLQKLIELGVDRVLTSGGKAKAIDAIDEISYLNYKYGDRIEILAGSGVNANNIDVFKNRNIKQIHTSCLGYAYDSSNKNPDLSYDYIGKDKYEIADENKIIEIIKKR